MILTKENLKVLKAASSDESRPVLCKAHIVKDAESPYVEASDSFIMVRQYLPKENVEDMAQEEAFLPNDKIALKGLKELAAKPGRESPFPPQQYLHEPNNLETYPSAQFLFDGLGATISVDKRRLIQALEAMGDECNFIRMHITPVNIKQAKPVYLEAWDGSAVAFVMPLAEEGIKVKK